MRFSLHGGSAEEEAAIKDFSARLGAEFVAHMGMPGEEPLLVIQCFPRQLGLVEAISQVTQWLDGGPLPDSREGLAQDPLPGLDTPPCL